MQALQAIVHALQAKLQSRMPAVQYLYAIFSWNWISSSVKWPLRSHRSRSAERGKRQLQQQKQGTRGRCRCRDW
jgi:hypothetical protein